MSRLSRLSVELSRYLNDNYRSSDATLTISSGTQDGVRFTAEDRRSMIMRGIRRLEMELGRNIARDLQNATATSFPYLTQYRSVISSTSHISSDEPSVVSLIDYFRAVTQSGGGGGERVNLYRSAMVVSNDFFDAVEARNYSVGSNTGAYFTLQDNKYVQDYPNQFHVAKVNCAASLVGFDDYVDSFSLTDLVVPTTTDDSFGLSLNLFAKQVLSVRALQSGEYKDTQYVQVAPTSLELLMTTPQTARLNSDAFFNDVARIVGNQRVEVVVSSGTVTTPLDSRYIQKVDYITGVGTPFVKLEMPDWVNVVNRTYSKTLFEKYGHKVVTTRVSGSLINDEFVPSDPRYSPVMLDDLVSVKVGTTKVYVFNYDTVDKLVDGVRPNFYESYGSAVGSYTARAVVSGSDLIFPSNNMTYLSHIASITGIKKGGFYEDGGDKFVKVSMKRLREYQNGTVPLQDAYMSSVAGSKTILFADNDTGVKFYPESPYSEPTNVTVEYIGIADQPLIGHREGQFVTFPERDYDDIELVYKGFSPDTVFYTTEADYQPFVLFNPAAYTGSMTIYYTGIPQTTAFYSYVNGQFKLSRPESVLEVLYVGKSIDQIKGVVTLRNSSIEYKGSSDVPSDVLQPSLPYRYQIGDAVTVLSGGNDYVYCQVLHPEVTYSGQDIQYPIDFDNAILNYALAYGYEMDKDIENMQIALKTAASYVNDYISKTVSLMPKPNQVQPNQVQPVTDEKQRKDNSV